MIKAPDNLLAIYQDRKGARIGEKVMAFAENGDALILDPQLGRLISVHEMRAEYSLGFIGLEYR